MEATTTQLPAGITPTSEINKPTTVPSKPLLFARDDDLYRTDLEGRTVEQLTTGGALGWGMRDAGDDWRINALAAPRVSPDGRRIAFSPDGSTLLVVDTREPAGALLAIAGSAIFAWSPDSQRLAYAMPEGGVDRGQLMVYDFVTGATTPLLANLVTDIGALAWSPDGSRVAFACCFEEDFSASGEYLGTLTGQLKTVVLATGQTAMVGPLWRSVAGGIQPFCWTSANQVIGLEAGDRTQPESFCSTPADSSLSPDGRRHFSMRFPPDATATDRGQLVVEDASGELWRQELEDDLWPVAWSPNGDDILLDDSTDQHSPIWRIPANGAGEPELIIDDGYLLAVIAPW